MTTRINLNSPSKDIALLLINKQNGINLNYSVVGISGAVSIPNAPSGKNSAVTVMSLPDNVYYGNVQVEYDRLDISELLGKDITYVDGPVFTIPEVLKAINTYCGLGLTADEIKTIDFSANGTAIIGIADSVLYLENKTFMVRDEFDQSVDNYWNLVNVILPAVMKPF